MTTKTAIATTLCIILMAGCIAQEPPHANIHVGAKHKTLQYAAPMMAGNSSDGQWIQPSGNASPAFTAEAPTQGETAQPVDPDGGGDAVIGDGSINSDANRTDTHWGKGHIYVKAATLGVHYNLNQPAKAIDASADEWSLIFAPDAPFRADDTLWFCGPDSDIHVQVYDKEADLILYDGEVMGVTECP